MNGFRIKLGLVGIAVLATLPTHAANFLVGSGAGCQFSTIQAGVNAAAANPGADTVRIANSGTYVAEAVTIGSQDVTIDGAFAACADTTPGGGNAIISGLGGTAAPVFTITGAGTRTLSHISATRGDQTATGEGGGIRFEGSGDLFLSAVILSNNIAGFGGGISVKGVGGEARLTLLSDTLVIFNEAVTGGGGGIRLDGQAVLYVEQPRVQIANNSAINGAGGGLLVVNGIAVVSSEGFGNGIIADNTARDGGGIALFGTNDAARPLLMYTTNANAPVRLRGNRARLKGGAIYTNGRMSACVNDFHLDDNRAEQGAAIYSDFGDDGIGGTIKLNFDLCGLNAAPSIVACTRNQNGCNTIENNIAETTAGAATTGATILNNLGVTQIRDVTFRNNRGGSVWRLVEEIGPVMRNVLFTGNNVTGPLIRVNIATGDIHQFFQHNTIAGNVIGANQVIQFENGPEKLSFNHNLIFQPGKVSVTLPFAIANSANYNWDFNATSDSGELLPPPWQAINIEPRFTNSATGDFRLRVGSSLVDLYPATAAVGATRDLDNRVRPVDLSIVSNRTVDVGAYERQENDPWLVNGNFDGNTSAWVLGGLTSYSTLNATGSSGGSIAFSRGATAGATTPRFNAGVQCFNVPGPGIYRLNAAGRGTATNFTAGDSPVIRWRVRSTVGNNCGQAAPIAQEGDLFLPNRAVFALGATPAEITIPPGAWNRDTTIELRLDVVPAVLDAAISAGFDRVEITGTGVDRIFANGFEQ